MHSDYFTHHKTRNNIVGLHNFDPAGVKQMLQWCYTGDYSREVTQGHEFSLHVTLLCLVNHIGLESFGEAVFQKVKPWFGEGLTFKGPGDSEVVVGVAEAILRDSSKNPGGWHPRWNCDLGWRESLRFML